MFYFAAAISPFTRLGLSLVTPGGARLQIAVSRMDHFAMCDERFHRIFVILLHSEVQRRMI